MRQSIAHDRSYDAPALQVSTGATAHMMTSAAWGAAVHGSSAFLQATGASPDLDSSGHCKAPQQAHVAQYSHSAPGLGSSSGPTTSDSTDVKAYNHAHQQHPWNQAYLNSVATSSAHQCEFPSPPPWHQQQQTQTHAQNYYAHGTHHQHNYYPQQQQHAWQGYHAYSASGPNPAVGAHGWQNWRSYSGYLHAASHGPLPPSMDNSPAQPQAPIPTSYSSTLPDRPQQQPPWRLTAQPALPPPQPSPQQEQTRPEVNNLQTSSCARASSSNSHKRAASFEATLAASGQSDQNPEGASADEPYDPLADVMTALTYPIVSSSPCATASPLSANSSRDGINPHPSSLASPHLHLPHGGGGPVQSPEALRFGHEKQHANGVEASAPQPVSMQLQPQPPSGSVQDLVIVWDLDETLIIFNSLLSGAFVRAAACASPSWHGGRSPAAAAEATAKVAPGAAGIGAEGSRGEGGSQQAEGEPSSLAAAAMVLGQQLADLVFNFCDTHLSFQELDSIDPLCFAALCAAAKTAEGIGSGGAACGREDGSSNGVIVCETVTQRIAEIYGGGSEQLSTLLGEPDCRTLAAVMAEAEALTGGWVAAARRLLAELSAAAQPSFAVRRVRHVLVSAGHLVASLGKLLLWGLDKYFDIWDVYSASGTPKLHVFRALAGRLGPAHIYAAVGDGAEEERAAAAMGWGFVRVGLVVSSAPRASAPERSRGSQGDTGSAKEEMPVWQVARPVGAIRAADVFGAAQEAYQ